MDTQALRDKANTIRQHIIRQVYLAGSGHPGGSLSAADIATVLYFDHMNLDADDPANPERDRFVLSKGHASPLLYACLAEKGFFPTWQLDTFRKLGSPLQGHPSMRSLTGVEMSTGSLGQGFSAAVGMALAARLDDRRSRVYVLLGDGELQEGIVWEAAMASAHYKLDNLCAIVDFNGLQIDGKNDDVMRVAPVDQKFEAFGWHASVIDGHDIDAIRAGLLEAQNCKGRPTVLVANTVKGKGVSFMENEAGWHGKAPNREQAEQAMAELGGIL